MASQVSATTSASASMNNNSLPASGLPDQFVIGKYTLAEPLVGIRAVKGHLSLLHAFSELKYKMVQLPFFNAFGKWKDDDKWRYFVGVAVERFDVWCEKLSEDDLGVAWDVFLPPLDVVMVWHSYLLNPLWYAEDAQRIARCSTLSQLGCHFISAIESAHQLSVLKYASQERKSFWKKRALLDFDPEECLQTYRRKSIKNLCCGQVDEIDFCNKNRTGYLQREYFHACSNELAHDTATDHVGRSFNHVNRSRRMDAVQKLAKDLATPATVPAGHLAGSYIGVSDSNRIRREGLKIKSLLISHIEAHPQMGQIDRSDRFIWEMSKCYAIPDIIGAIGSSALALRILSAYSDDKVYSIGLADAVVRQGQFVEKIKEIKWTVPDFLDNSDMRILPHAVARYHAFLDLMSAHPGTMLVPTLDIDLVWHTHQLFYSKYRDDCVKYVGKFIDHDDKIEGTQLSTSFDKTAVLWKNRFEVPYTFCGCPAPTPTIGQRLSSFISPAANQPTFHSSVITPPILKPEVTLATHSSAHNAVRRMDPRRSVSSAQHSAYLSLTRQKVKEIKKSGDSLYDSTACHPYSAHHSHPHRNDFLYPVYIYVDQWAGLDGGNQCVAGYSDPSEIAKLNSTSRSGGRSSGAGHYSGTTYTSVGGFSCAGGASGGCGAGGSCEIC